MRFARPHDPRQVFTNELRQAMIAEHDAALLLKTSPPDESAADAAYVPTHTTRKLDAYATDEAFRTDPRLRYIPGPL